MVWPTLHAVIVASRCEFTATLFKAHHFVRLSEGRWTRTLGVPDNATRVTGHIWHANKGS